MVPRPVSVIVASEKCTLADVAGMHKLQLKNVRRASGLPPVAVRGWGWMWGDWRVTWGLSLTPWG